MTDLGSYEELVAALGRKRRLIGDWSVRARDTERIEVGAAGALTRAMRRSEVTARIHVDAPTGRGSADLVLDTPEPLERLLDDAIARATASVGPSWRASPPGAPAKVAIADRQLEDPAKTVGELLAHMEKRVVADGAELIDGRAAIEVAVVALTTSLGQVARWTETRIELDVVVAIGGRTAHASQQARRRRDVRPAEVASAAVQRAAARGAAIATPAGRRPVLLPAELIGGDGARLLDALALLADASLHRQGLARARIGAPIVDGADTTAEPLDFGSDGTLRGAVRTAPLGDHGEPVRRFPIVERGVLVGLALDEREAALRGVPANGGVRTIVISGGASEPAALRAAGVLELHELSYVDLEPLTGRMALGIGLATLHQDGSTQAVTGGEVQGDLVASLARSRRTPDAITVGPYRGPALIQLPDLDVS